MPVKHPRVAVLLAAYNGMQWIEEQVDSILNQSAVDVTLFISIDPSSDGSADWCEACAIRNQRVIILPDVGRFGGASRNFFRLLRDVNIDAYDFVAFADQDDIWNTDKLHRATLSLESRHFDAYSSNVMAFWPDGKTVLLDKAQPQVKWDFLFEAAGPGCTYVISNRLAVSLRESIVVNWDQLQDVSLHDWYFYAYARSRGYLWYIDAKPSMQYRQHEYNQVGANTGLKALFARYKSIRDGWWFNQVLLIAKLVDHQAVWLRSPGSSLHRGQLIKLSFRAWQCRRRVRDKLFFFVVCWVAAMTGVKTG
ncbi:glycosyltransferase [Pseudomonas fluorescens]|uniref:Glycosyltransferase 2-like domain-containing protein n=1 Tax=Pseudomonas fluorescens TaxID=294 RepID=A0A5E6UD31_PSEFL|nr:glycosyltransferase [Pseudomonas fluorescens]VVN02931.1 hypothetical protein PS655_03437 [Pseudomonas fluorescens]